MESLELKQLQPKHKDNVFYILEIKRKSEKQEEASRLPVDIFKAWLKCRDLLSLLSTLPGAQR